jgi:hypothetical protein
MEVYTDLFVIQGYLAMGSQRSSDVLNRANTNFVPVHNASITPLGQPPSPKILEMPVMVRLSLINFVVEMPSAQAAPSGPPTPGHPIYGREAYVTKDDYPCYAITGPYAIYGHCYLHKGTLLENLLQGVDTFMPITRPTVYALSHAPLNWKPSFVLVNKSLLTAMYIMPRTE